MLFLLFLIIDLVVASVLMSMGMMMLPPVVVSLPFKLIFFVLVDGWTLVAGSLYKVTEHKAVRQRTAHFRTISPIVGRRHSKWNNLELLSVVGLTTVEQLRRTPWDLDAGCCFG